MATFEIRTSPPETTVPVRSLITTLARRSGSTVTFSILVKRLTSSSRWATGTAISMPEASRAFARLAPNWLLMAVATRLAVV
ncbi:hypothetical protein D3C86_1835140 [compost metagenome]